MTLNESKQILATEAAIKARGITEEFKKKLPYLADEIESAAGWGAVRAASTYKDDGGDSWERWSNKLIKGSIKNIVKKECVREKKRIQFRDLKQQIKVVIEVPTEADPTDAKTVLVLIDTLDGQDRIVCDLVYRQGQTLKAAANIMGIGLSYASKLHKRALATLKFALPD